MLRFVGKIGYTDGTEVEFEAGNAAMAAWERYAVRHGLPMGKDSPPTISSLVIAHYALGIEQGADAWMETVDSVECDVPDAPDGADAVPPTLEAASAA